MILLLAYEVPVILQFIQVEFFLKIYDMENVENTISEPLDFKLYEGGYPRPSCKLAPSALVFKPPLS